jgi:hypothetical protein
MIKKLKDIFYDLNDIMVALIIIAVAALVIAANIDSILAYPSSIAEEIQLPGDEAPTQYAENPPIGDQNGGETDGQGTIGAGADTQNGGGQNTDGQSSSGTAGQTATGGGVSGNTGQGQTGQPGQSSANGSGGSGGSGSESAAPAKVTVSIPSGATGDKIADILIGAGLVKSRQEFNQAVAAVGAEGKLQAGNFTIPSNATPAEIVSIITK